MDLNLGSSHSLCTMSMDIALTQLGTSRVGRIEEPQIPVFSRQAQMGWTTME